MIEITEHKQVEGEVDQYRRHLEELVGKHTADLSKANKQLRFEVVERKKAEEVARRQIKQLTVLRDITLAITSTLDLKSVLDKLLEKIEFFLPYHASTVRLLDQSGKVLEPIACRNLDIESWKAGHVVGFVREIINNRLPVTSINVQLDSRTRRPEFFRKHGLVSFIGVPLIAREKLIGVLSLYTSEIHKFNGEEIDLITMIATQAAVAIDNSKLYQALHCTREELRELAKRLQITREEEKSRLARQLHDELAQQLVALKMELAVLGEPSGGNSRSETMVTQFYDRIDTMMEMIRNIGEELRPVILNDLGLGGAIEHTARNFQSRTGMQCQIIGTLEGKPLDPDRSTAVFRIFQEALSNVERHSKAKSIRVEVKKTKKDILLTVSDDGQGLETAQLNNLNSHGVIGMRERAFLCRGELYIRGVLGQGTTVSLRVPRVL